MARESGAAKRGLVGLDIRTDIRAKDGHFCVICSDVIG